MQTQIETAESRQVWIPCSDLKPSPENDQLYRDDEAGLALFAENVKREGILEPLVVTKDNFIVSGHRRYAAAKRAGLVAVPIRRLSFARSDRTKTDYIKLLREFNRQRSKTIDEILREAAVDANPEVAYTALVKAREVDLGDFLGAFEIHGQKHRAEISENKRSMLDAALSAIEALRAYHPLTVRQVHYRMLSAPPLRHAKKQTSTYRNDRASYQDLCDLLVRARVSRKLSWDAITDETRPVRRWRTSRNVGEFTQKELSSLFDHYWRDVLQSQADHFEIIVEKNSSLSVIEKVAQKYTITTTSGRGQICKEKLHAIRTRFCASRKDRLILFTLSDFDPDGDAISNANALSLRDDMSIPDWKIVPVRVALRPDQIEKYHLPKSLEAKVKSSNYSRFVLKHGVTYAVELEAFQPAQIQTELDNAIRSYLDVDLFNQEVEKEKAEAADLQKLKNRITLFLQNPSN